MIAYEELVTALTNWRINQGLPTSTATFLSQDTGSVDLALPVAAPLDTAEAAAEGQEYSADDLEEELVGEEYVDEEVVEDEYVAEELSATEAPTDSYSALDDVSAGVEEHVEAFNASELPPDEGFADDEDTQFASAPEEVDYSDEDDYPEEMAVDSGVGDVEDESVGGNDDQEPRAELVTEEVSPLSDDYAMDESEAPPESADDPDFSAEADNQPVE